MSRGILRPAARNRIFVASRLDVHAAQKTASAFREEKFARVQVVENGL